MDPHGFHTPTNLAFLYSHSTDHLYVRHAATYEIHARARSRIYSFDTTWLDYTGIPHHFPIIKHQQLPPDAVPVEVAMTTDGWRIPATVPPLIPSQTSFAATFADFLDQQPDYIAALLPRFNCADIYQFCALSQDLSNLVIVSDGGAIPYQASFGWIISTQSGIHLASGQGPVFGYDPRSYRAEAYGCKAALTFVSLAHEFCDSRPQGILQVYYDNLGLKKKLDYFNSYRLAIVKTVLDSEWDVLNGIHSLTKTFPALPVFTHVLGHQDDTIPYTQLPLVSQLNVQADKLAPAELHDFSSHVPKVPFDPTSCIMFHLNEISVTRRIATSIRTHCALPALRKYYAARFNWTIDVFDSIDWDTFSNVYTKLKDKRVAITKFCVNHLPTSKRIHSRDSFKDDQCPTCYQSDETDDHLLCCPATSRSLWRSDLLKSITNQLAWFLDPVLYAILRAGLDSYFHHQYTIDPATFPRSYQLLIKHQNRIGWNHFV